MRRSLVNGLCFGFLVGGMVGWFQGRVRLVGNVEVPQWVCDWVVRDVGRGVGRTVGNDEDNDGSFC